MPYFREGEFVDVIYDNTLAGMAWWIEPGTDAFTLRLRPRPCRP